MILNDRQILEAARQGMIKPFEEKSIKMISPITSSAEDAKVAAISWGLSSYGYDIRLSPEDFRFFRRIPGNIVDPKDFNPDNLEQAKLHHSSRGDYFIVPANSYALGASMEAIAMPTDVLCVAVGKSTLARAGIIANTTPLEPSWRSSSITLEFSNAASSDVKIYAREGVVQLLFFRGEQCDTTYADRSGKYQNQGKGVALPRV